MKTLIGIIIVVIVIGGGAYVYISSQNKNISEVNTQIDSPKDFDDLASSYNDQNVKPACEYLTLDIVEKYLGTPSSRDLFGGSSPDLLCAYKTPRGLITINIINSPKSGFDGIRATYSSDDIQIVSGIGEDAYWLTVYPNTSIESAGLFFYKNGVSAWGGIASDYGMTSEGKAVMENIAKEIVDKIN